MKTEADSQEQNQQLAKVDTADALKTTQNQEVMSVEKLRFAEWLSQPRGARNPKTQGELARELGVTQETLSRWKQSKPIILRVFENLRANGWDRVPAVLDALVARAERGDPRAVKMFLELYFGWCEKASLQVELEKEIRGGTNPFRTRDVRPEELPSWMTEGQNS